MICRIAGYAAPAALVFLCCTCSRPAPSLQSGGTLAQRSSPWQLSLPPLPADALRQATAEEPVSLAGAGATAMSGGAQVVDTTAVLPAGPGKTEWAYYALPTAGSEPLRVEGAVLQGGGKAWVGVSDYSRGCWDFRGQPDGVAFSYPATADNVSPAYYVYVLVVAHDEVSATVMAVSLIVDRPGWVIHTVDDLSSPGRHVKLFADGPGGYPHLVYLDAADQNLKLARATTVLPTDAGDWVKHTVDSRFSPNKLMPPLDAQFISGKPAIVYGEYDGQILRYARAMLPQPASSMDWVMMTLDDQASSLNRQAALCEVGGLPQVAFTRSLAGGNWLAVTDTAEPLPVDWGLHPFTADSTTYSPSMAERDGTPAMAYLEATATGYQIHYALALSSSPGGVSDWPFIDVYSTSQMFQAGRTCLVFAPHGTDQCPAVSFIHGSPYQLMVLRAIAPNPGELDWDWNLLDTSGVSLASLGVASNRITAAWYNTGTQALTMAWAKDQEPSGDADWDYTNIEVGLTVTYLSLATVAGLPTVAYRDDTANALKFAYLD